MLGIVKGEIVFEEIEPRLADQFGEPVAELRTCLSENAATPETAAEAAVAERLTHEEDILLRRWQRIGVGFD